MNQRILLFFIGIFSLLTACGKSENTPASVLEFLTQTKWTGFDDLVDEKSTGNFVSLLEECSKDDQWVFNAEGTGEVTDGTDVCEPDIPLEISFDWELRNNDTILYIAIGGSVIVEEMECKILSISETKMELLVIDPANPSSLRKEKIIFSR